MNPTWTSDCGTVRLWLGDCLDVMATWPDGAVDAVVTDPPYPNNAAHFESGILAAREVAAAWQGEGVWFWDDIDELRTATAIVAIHVWHRSNTNRPDNYERVYWCHPDGIKRASRVLSFPVVYPGLTGCHEATGHPTQKNERLMCRLVGVTSGQTIADPFMGSGTTGVAAVRLGRSFWGVELDPGYFESAKKRIQDELRRVAFLEGNAEPKQRQRELAI